jgi:phosphatidate cytidylyltransferase
VKRILTSLVGLPVLFAVIKYLPPRAFLALVSAAVVLGCYEFYALAETRGLRPHKLLGAVLGVAAAWTFFFDAHVGTVDILCAAALIVPVASLARCRSAGGRLEQEFGGIAATYTAVIFVGLLMGYSLALMGNGDESGRDLTVLLFWIVWLSDAAAYTVGSLAGRHKLAPSISPGKTVEGAVGAVAVAVAAALVARIWFFTRLSLRDALALGFLLGVAGMVGDLAESLLKRSAGVKDSGWLFPGHGGMLDRADSLLFAAPVLFYYHKYFMITG